MIPALPELLSASSSNMVEVSREKSGLLQADLPDGALEASGESPPFGDLLTSALEPTSFVVLAKGQGSATPGSTISAPDTQTKVGNALPIVGSDVPEIEDQASPPSLTGGKLSDLSSLQTAPTSNSGTSKAASDAEPVPAISASLSNQTAKPVLDPQSANDLDSRVVDPTVESGLQPEHAEKQGLRQTQQFGGDDAQFEADPRLPANDSAAQAPAKDSPAALDEPALVAVPLSPRNMRADQPISDLQRTKAAGATIKGGAIAASTANGSLEGRPIVDPEPSGARKLVEATPATPSGPTLTAHLAQAGQPASDLGQSTQSQQTPTLTAPVLQPTVTQPLAATEVRGEARVAPQIEQAIDALTDAREAGRASRPEVLVRHSEFGLVSMRLEAASGDLRATLASRDPGFIPAVQAALSERSVAASSETATSHNNQRGQDHSQGNQSSASFSGSNGGFGQNYGSSPGSSQGSSQPRMAQQDDAARGADGHDPVGTRETPSSIAGGGGVFA